MSHAHQRDLDLAARIQEREEAAAQELFRNLGPEMLGYARRMLTSPDSAEDVLQEAMMGALSSIEKYDGRVSLRAWIYGILRHKIFDAMRKSGREITISTEDPETSMFQDDGRWKEGVTFSPWNENAEMLEVVQECIEGLPANQKEALMLRALKGLSSKEAAEIMNLSDANLRQILHRARQSVRKCAEGKLGEVA